MSYKIYENLNKLSYLTKLSCNTSYNRVTTEWKYIETITLERDNKVKCLCTACIYKEVNIFYNMSQNITQPLEISEPEEHKPFKVEEEIKISWCCQIL